MEIFSDDYDVSRGCQNRGFEIKKSEDTNLKDFVKNGNLFFENVSKKFQDFFLNFAKCDIFNKPEVTLYEYKRNFRKFQN